MIRGSGRGKRISLSLVFYLWFSHIATENCFKASGQLINHLINQFCFFFLVQIIFTPCWEGGAAAEKRRCGNWRGGAIFLLCFVVYALLVFFVCHHVIVFVE